ncbi:MAG: LysR family transcriptional regulator [Acidaminococcus sp.]|nr:LysR family transcriptional regulator [Acidaminococcus sp.]MCI2099968.1 LysR family transcriptional regulator [Acidaminococcus sp.]MCI2114244.1 LysR family transcriptional regulator [Acidaminococcus sp.]MCI2116242.1 LysR family transcriptional regulator [Acidaminococcus sp.]
MRIETYLLEQLSAFRKAGTISGAAEALHMSQPALSRSMQKLEKMLGVTLFVHQKNRLYLTEIGNLAADYADRILRDQDEMIETLLARDGMLRTISIGSCAPGPLLAYTYSLPSFFPGRTIATEMNKDEDQLIEKLKRGHFNLIFLSHAVDIQDFCCVPCGTEHLFINVIPAHPAALFKDKGVTFAEMDGETFLMNASIGVWEDITREHLPNSLLVLQDNMESLSAVVNTSTLPSFTTDLAQRVFNGRYKNRIDVPFNDPEATLSFYAIFPKKSRKNWTNWIEHIKEEWKNRTE